MSTGARTDQGSDPRVRGWHARIAPESGRVGEWGTWTVTITVGAAGLRPGGAVQVALPDRWHQWYRNSARRVQATEPEEPFYVSASAGRAGVRLRCEVQEQEPFRGDGTDEHVKRPRTGIDGRPSRYAWVVRVMLESGELMPGDTIAVRYGDRSGGSRGFTPPLWTGSPEHVRAAVDPDGSGHFALLPEEALPLLRAIAGEPVELSLIVPSCTVVGELAEVLVVALDAQHNPVCRSDLAVQLRVVQGEAQLLAADGSPVRVAEMTLDDAASWGSARVRLLPRAPGIIRLRGQSADGRLYAMSNPSRCTATAPRLRLYWGDLHSHSHLSWDGTGAADDHFRYARDVAGLDFYGNADHGESLSAADWQQVLAWNRQHYRPGRFVTLVGYENSFRYPYQHHNVFYRAAEGRLLHSRDASLPEFWAQATPGQVLTIPHHTAALGRPGRPGIDWSIRDDRFRRLVELYSSHGQSEAYAPLHPLASDVVDFTFAGPYDPPSYAQDGWMTGQRMGVIASSDNHASQPGVEGFGLAAVWAPELTREAIFDALLQRQTYGTTGSRLLLDFAANGVPMGGECIRQAGEPVEIIADVSGSGPLRLVEIVRGDLERGEWRVTHRAWYAGGDAPLDLSLRWVDEAPPARALYYLRVRQRDLVHGRVAMAWSSPVWVDMSGAAGHTASGDMNLPSKG